MAATPILARTLATGALVFLACTISCTTLAAQKVVKPRVTKDAATDPYTKNDPTTLKKLGYVSFGPFDWDGKHSTKDVTFMLGASQLRWVETAHFKLGCGLAPRAVPGESKWRRMVAKELRRLNRKLFTVPKASRVLDRWLLLHLYAQRLEELYAQFSRQLGVKEGDFPRRGRAGTSKHYMGEGKFLGQRAKFNVILFDREVQLARYLQAFAGIRARPIIPRRHEFSGIGSLVFTTASECHNGLLFGEVQMHAHLVDEVVKNLTVGYKSNLIELPNWWVEGLGHWYRRRIDPRINFLDPTVDGKLNDPRAWNWTRRVKARVKNGHFLDADELVRIGSVHLWKVQQHMMAWSRVDFLLQADPKGARRFLDHLNDVEKPIRSANNRRDLQEAALKKGWGLDLATFDARWKEYATR